VKHVMIDIETLGIAPGSTILSIGAVPFTEDGIDERYGGFDEVISRRSCREAGLTEDPETLRWWEDQPKEASKVIAAANQPRHGSEVANVLRDFRTWLSVVTDGLLEDLQVWSLGASFDVVLLDEAYRRTGYGQAPWDHRNGRCLRTLAALRPDVPRPKPEVAHDALSDAIAQALWAAALLRAVSGRAT
jgi:3' exoribonuclease, RNase T-like